MIKLYQLYDNATRQPISEPTFKTLCAARRARRERNRAERNPLRYVVVPGPDHPKHKP